MEYHNQPANIHSDFGLVEFSDEANFDQFVDFFRGENTHHHTISNLCPKIDCDNISSCSEASHQQNYGVSINSGDMKVLEEENVGEESSAMTTTTTTKTTTMTTTKITSQTKKTTNKVDRSRALITERRRSSMKQMLYALRELVPNITKMDKTSIIGDAVAYVEDLQMQGKKLKAEIYELESSLRTQTNKYNGIGCFSNNLDNINIVYNYPHTKKITKLDVFQVEEREFYVRVGAKEGKGVAVQLSKVLESFVSTNITNSNLITADEVYILTFTLRITKEGNQVVMTSNDLKIWIATSFLSQGFDFDTTILLA